MKVNAFASEVGSLNNIPVVDAVIVYDCPFTGESYFLLMYNCLYIPSMECHLIPPFILREAGLLVNDTPKIQSMKPDEDTHVIYDSESEMRIHLGLNGIFSYFKCRSIAEDEMRNWQQYKVVESTPMGQKWDPYNPVYREEEEAMLDGRGEVLQKTPDRIARFNLIEKDDWDQEAELQSSYCEPMSVHEYDSMIASNFSNTSTMLGSADVVDARFLDVMDDKLKRGVSTIDSCLLEDELADAMESLEIKTSYGIAAGSLSADVTGDNLFYNSLEAMINSAAATFSTLASNPKGVSADSLSKIWRISQEEAELTLQQTTQLGRFSADNTLAREVGTGDRALRYKRYIDTVFYTDTLHVTGEAKSTRGFKYAQVYVSDKGFIHIHFMTALNQGAYMEALRGFCKEVGVPTTLVCDPHATQKSAAVRKFLYEVGTTLRVLERATQWANLAERFIGLLKNGVRADLRDSDAPLVLWDYCMERRVRIMNLTARSTHKLQGLNPYTKTFHQTADISNICNFGWFEWCYYREDSRSAYHKFPKALEKLGRCLGPSKDHGNEMCQWILSDNGIVKPCRTIRRLTPHELSVTNEAEKDKRSRFMQEIRRKLGDSLRVASGQIDTSLDPIEEETVDEMYQIWLDDSEDYGGFMTESTDGEAEALSALVSEVKDQEFWAPYADIFDASGEHVGEQSLTDTLIGVEILLPQSGEKGAESKALCKVLRRSVNKDGATTGIFDDNPALNTLIYDVQFPNGMIEQYGANIIAQNVMDQVEDESGHYSARLKSVLDHRRQGNAVSKAKRYITSRNGQRKLRQSTAGWMFLVEYTDGRKDWMQLKDLKETNPVEIAEYVTARGIDDEVAFQWWVPYTLRKKQRIIAAVKSRVQRKTHKYGIEIPRSVAHAFQLDRESNTTFWQDALALEMNELMLAVRILGDEQQLPPGYIKSSGHIIFDVKMDFRRKARWVQDGHKTPEPTTSNYAGVVSRESVRIAFTYASMMGLSVCAADIKNAYLQAPSSEKHFIICGEEWGLQNIGKRAIIDRAIYGSRVAGRDFWLHLRTCMEQIGFKSSKGDPDVWYRAATKSDGTEYYEYVLLYVDDCLVVSENAELILREEIGKYWHLKESSIGKPQIYLGGKCREVELDNGTKCWAFGSSQYVQSAVENVKAWLAKSGRKLPKRAEAPFKTGYRPEIDISRELAGEEASYYQSLIGILRWMVELGRVDICLEVSLMSSHLALPREGHLECLFHIFAYLEKFHNAEMVFDPTEPQIDPNAFKRQDWTYSTMSESDRTEVLPPDMPRPLGKGFVIRCFVDADHAGDEITRRSRTGFIVYLNNAPVYWYSKRQGSVESSTYQAEFTAMREATEYIRALRYKLRMMGIPVEDAAYIFGDNQSVLANTTNPGSTLKKKCAAVAYHVVREGVARGEWITAYINTHDNIADLLTKPMASGEKRNGFVKKILQHIFRKEK